MITYKYQAITFDGKEETGKVNAQNRDDAIAKLRGEYSRVKSLKEFKEKEDFRDTLQIRKVNEKNLSLICQQFSIILKSGMPIVRTVEMVAGQTDDKYLKKILQEVAEDIESGHGMADSFAERGPKLPVTFIETVRAGEETGSLDMAFERLSKFYEKKSKTRDKVISALTYPAMVVGVAIIVIFIIMIFAVPQFVEGFASMGTELPVATRALIAMSNFFKHFGWLIALIIIAFIVFVKIYDSNPERKIKTDKLRLKLPILGKVHHMNACSQFANTLSTMMAAGLPALRSIRITGQAMTNAYIGDCVLRISDDVRQGFRIGQSLKAKNCFPDLLTEMTTVGEETGSIEETLTVVGEYYDNEVDVVTTRATKLLEPTIICILAVFVVFILLAAYLPMFSMYDTVQF